MADGKRIDHPPGTDVSVAIPCGPVLILNPGSLKPAIILIMHNLHFCLPALLLACASGLLAGTAAPAGGAPRPSFRYGGDIRLRQELWDDIPLPTETPLVTRNGFNNTYRLRSRAFAAYDFTDRATANVRFMHMFYDTVAGPESFKWPDELSLDTANLELHDLTGDGSKLVLGRQDILLGSGRLIFEGTALDAARSTFFDGLFLHQPLAENFSTDLFAVYDKDEDECVVGHVHRQLRGYSPSVDGRDEAGAGIFLNGSFFDGALPGSLYYVWKHETTARAADGSRIPNADIHTAGFLARPKFSQALSGEFEFARQFDPADADGIDATLTYAGLFLKWDELTMPSSAKGSLTAFPGLEFGLDCLYLSGDDPDTKRNEAFNPIFSRYPFISELMIYCFDTEGAGNWNNIIHPRATIKAKYEGHALALAAGPVYAEERNGAGGGRNRGVLYTTQWNFPLLSGSKSGCGKTDGCILAEILDPGDYYLSGRTAYFFRWQISVAF